MGILFLVYITFGIILATVLFLLGEIKGPTIEKYPIRSRILIFVVIMLGWLPCLIFSRYTVGQKLEINLHI